MVVLYMHAILKAQEALWSDNNSLFWKHNGVAVMFSILHDGLILAGGPDQLMGKFDTTVERWGVKLQQHCGFAKNGLAAEFKIRSIKRSKKICSLQTKFAHCIRSAPM